LILGKTNPASHN